MRTDNKILYIICIPNGGALDYMKMYSGYFEKGGYFRKLKSDNRTVKSEKEQFLFIKDFMKSIDMFKNPNIVFCCENNIGFAATQITNFIKKKYPKVEIFKEIPTRPGFRITRLNNSWETIISPRIQ